MHFQVLARRFGNAAARYRCDFTGHAAARNLECMRQSAAILCRESASLQTLERALGELEIEQITFSSKQEILERVLEESCSVLIVDFDLPGAGDVVKMAALLAPPQKPFLLALATRAWPGTGEAFQSGANRILYKPLEMAQLKDALEDSRKLMQKNQRKSPRHEMKTVVYLEVETGTLPAMSIDISEQGFAVQATEAVPMRSKLAFHCVLPGTDYTLRGYADVVWASDHGRAGLFFSSLAASARKRLKQWLKKRGADSENALRALRPPVNAEVCTAVSE